VHPGPSPHHQPPDLQLARPHHQPPDLQLARTSLPSGRLGPTARQRSSSQAIAPPALFTRRNQAGRQYYRWRWCRPPGIYPSPPPCTWRRVSNRAKRGSFWDASGWPRGSPGGRPAACRRRRQAACFFLSPSPSGPLLSPAAWRRRLAPGGGLSAARACRRVRPG
jgi:hypothetical protein